MAREERNKEESKPVESARVCAESVHVVAQTISNLLPLSEPAAAALAPDAEYRLREIIQDGLKFMKHSKRSHLTTGDINAALRLRNVEPIYGFGSKKRKRSSGDSALEASARGLVGQPAAAHSAPVTEGSYHAKFQQVDGVPELYFVEDTEESVKSIIQQQLPSLPLEATVRGHWLAVDGKQPAIAQNPTKRARKLSSTESSDAGKLNRTSNRPSVEVKPMVKHDLSRELQLYHEQVVTTLHSDDKSQLESVLNSVAEEPGLVQMLPYFTVFITNTVSKSLQNLPLLLSLMRLVNAILTNEVFNLERYLHQLLPAVLSCLVGRRLYADQRENHWALRDYAAALIAKICVRYRKDYPNLQPRITKTLVDSLTNMKRPLTTHYGAIVGTASLGRQVVDALLKPFLPEYATKVQKLLLKSKENKVRRYEACKVYGAIVWAFSVPAKSRLKTDDSNIEGSLLSNQVIRPSVQVLEENLSEVLPNCEPILDILRAELGPEMYPYGTAHSEADLAEYALKINRSQSNT